VQLHVRAKAYTNLQIRERHSTLRYCFNSLDVIERVYTYTYNNWYACAL